MNQQLSQRKIEFATLERPNAWIVVAFVVEFHGEEKIIVSAPKVVKVILKKNLALTDGKKQQTLLALPAPISHAFAVQAPLPSPYVATIFGFSNSDVVIGLAARPPTIF